MFKEECLKVDQKIERLVRDFYERISLTDQSLDKTEKKIDHMLESNQTRETLQADFNKGIDINTKKNADDIKTLFDELRLLRKEFEIVLKIVCHMSGAKDSANNRELFYEELSRRLAKIEDREDGNE
jgi:hypothetical protein